MGHSDTDLKFSVNIELYIFKTLSVQSFTKISKIPIPHLNERDHF